MRITRKWQWFALVFTIGFLPPLGLAIGLYVATGYWQFAYLALLGNFATPIVGHWLCFHRDRIGPIYW